MTSPIKCLGFLYITWLLLF